MRVCVCVCVCACVYVCVCECACVPDFVCVWKRVCASQQQQQQQTNEQAKAKSKQTNKLTDPNADDNSASQEHLLARGHRHDHSARSEDERSNHDGFLPAEKVAHEAGQQGENSSGPDGSGHDDLMPDRAEVEVGLDQQHGARHDARVVAEEQSADGGEAGQHVHEGPVAPVLVLTRGHYVRLGGGRAPPVWGLAAGLHARGSRKGAVGVALPRLLGAGGKQENCVGGGGLP